MFQRKQEELSTQIRTFEKYVLETAIKEEYDIGAKLDENVAQILGESLFRTKVVSAFFGDGGKK